MTSGGGSTAGHLLARAPAKVNLTLAVRGRRADGYHELDSLVAFAGIADHLSLVPGPGLTLDVAGPTAGAAGPPDRNLVLRAARALAERVPQLRLGAFRLVKRLPAAAGIGGGSSDAAAALRLLAAANGLPIDHPPIADAAAATGADIPVCLHPRMRMMRGAGERVGPPLGGARLFAVLVNPGVAVPTADVFRGLGLAAGTPLAAAPPPPPPGGEGEAVIGWIAAGRNDLEPPALAVAPVIGTALAQLRATPGCRLARMSGSGATVFGLYDDRHAAAGAARAVRAARPGWWAVSTVLR